MGAVLCLPRLGGARGRGAVVFGMLLFGQKRLFNQAIVSDARSLLSFT